MFKLPVCPHCKAVYYYKDAIKASKSKTAKCHNCEKQFNVKKSGTAVLFLIIFVIATAVNIILLSTISSFDLASLFISTVTVIIIGFLFYPFFISFKK